MATTLTLRFSENSPISALTIRSHAATEAPGHGAPDTISLTKGSMPHKAFWDCASIINNALNMTPDHVNLRPAEIDRRNMFVGFDMPNRQPRWDFPNTRGRHVLAGGEDAYMDGIRREDVATVADKALREMRAIGLISKQDYQKAVDEMKTQGFQPAVYNGRDGKPDIESRPQDFKVISGYGLAFETRKYLETVHPPARQTGYGYSEPGRPRGPVAQPAYAQPTGQH